MCLCVLFILPTSVQQRVSLTEASCTSLSSGVGSLWPCGLLRSPRCSLRSSWCLSRSSAVPSGPRGVSVPSGPFGVPPYSPVCPPVPLVSLGSYSSVAQYSNSLVRPAAAAPFPGVLLPAVRWLSSLAVAHACIHTYITVAIDLV